jgi:formate hydrogenlyase subunit 6/NADH:ubiquinone oxidoreductase subunit I
MSTKPVSRQAVITPELKDNYINRVSRFLHVKAFRTTFRHMLRVPQTTKYHPLKRHHSQYPYVAERYRGLLALSEEACTGCRKCERICPNKVIIMQDREINGDTYRFPAYFAGRCMKCGLCEESCDRQFAIRHTDQFEDAGYIREQLHYEPERMFEMWDKHIEPRINAGIAHIAVPDKRRLHDDKKVATEMEKEKIAERKAQDEKDHRTY